MLRATASLAVLLAIPVTTAAQPQPPGAPAGNWLVQSGDGVIRLEPCQGDKLCGTVVGTSNTAQCRLTILNVAATEGGVWRGHITNPEDGSIWNVQIQPDGADRLRVRGYIVVPLLGQTQTWTRYTGRLLGNCRML